MFEFSFHFASMYVFLDSKSAITLSDPGMWAQVIHTLNFVQYSQLSFADSFHDLLLDDPILFITARVVGAAFELVGLMGLSRGVWGHAPQKIFKIMYLRFTSNAFPSISVIGINMPFCLHYNYIFVVRLCKVEC